VIRGWGTYRVMESDEKNKKKGRRDLGKENKLKPKTFT
jgi:hypothetical protein